MMGVIHQPVHSVSMGGVTSRPPLNGGNKSMEYVGAILHPLRQHLIPQNFYLFNGKPKDNRDNNGSH